MKFYIKKGETKVEELYFKSDQNLIEKLVIFNKPEGLMMMFGSGNFGSRTIPINESISDTDVSNYGWVWFEFAPAKEDGTIELFFK